MLIVTREMDFALSISDRVIFMEGGVVQVSGDPAQIRPGMADNPLYARVGRVMG